MVVFPLMFVGAVHKPTPHDLTVLVVGPDQVVADIAAGLDDTNEFSATHTDVAGEARTSVENRTVLGAIEVTVADAATATDAAPDAGRAAADTEAPSESETAGVGTDSSASASSPSFTVTTYVANAEGLSVAAAVQAAGDQIAAQLGTTTTVIDVASLAATDAIGTSLFYLLVYTSLGAYLVIIVLMQVMPSARLSVRFRAVGITSVLAPLIVFGLSSIFVGDYGASFGTIAGLLGVNALYVFTVGSAAILIEQFLGKAATFGIMAFVVFLNFPSAGGATPAALLPPFWQFVHDFYFGAGAYESFRSIVYFGGHGTERWLFQLLAWAIGLVLVNLVVYLTKTVFRQRKELAALTTATPVQEQTDGSGAAADDEVHPPKHVKVEAYELDHTPHRGPGIDSEAFLDAETQRSITAGEGAAR